MKKILVWTILLIGLAGLISGADCNSSISPPWTPTAHIEVTYSYADRDWNFSLGFYHDVTYTLTNTGDADGTATVEISGDYSGVLLTQQVSVSTGSSVTRTARVDSNERDNDIYVEIVAVH